MQILNWIKNNWRLFGVSVIIILSYFYGYGQANLKAEARHAKELQTQLEAKKAIEIEAAKLRTNIETQKQEFENEIKNNKVYSTCIVPRPAKLHINSIK